MNDDFEIASRTVENNPTRILFLVRQYLTSDIDRAELCCELQKLKDIENIYADKQGGLR